MEPATATQPHIADYLRPLWSRKWLILIAVVVATGGVYGYYAHKPKVYTSSTLVYVKDPGDPVSGVPSPQSTDRSVSNQAALLYSRDTAAAVAEKIHYAGTAEDLLRRVSITSRAGEDFVNVAARGRTPQEAATIANAYAHQFVTFVNDAQSSRIARALALSRQQLAALPRGPAASATRQNLSDQVARLELAAKVPSTVTRQVDPAVAPGAPSEPKPVRNALFAFILSLVLAAAVAFGVERFDRRLKRPEEVEDVYGSPLLAILPHTGDPAPTINGEAALSHDFRESFRVLRTNIELSELDAPPRTIVVSSATPGEGKSTVVRNLALAFRETGKRVAVVECDLRHPALGRLFGVAGGPGLTEILRHDATLGDVTLQVAAALPGFDELVRLDAERSVATNGHRNGNSNGHGNGNEAARIHDGAVTLLLSGATPANPPAVLASERLAQVLDDLRDRHDVVLIDSAPLLAVTDTVPLLRYADAALFVSRLGVTTRDTAKRLAEYLERIPDVNVLGVIANDLSQFEATGYGYGYGYGGYGNARPDEKRKRSARSKRAEKTKQTV
jgi:Mrp family chromosome partitioning ATPase/capsular polysaccharide biosynthesis protein